MARCMARSLLGRPERISPSSVRWARSSRRTLALGTPLGVMAMRPLGRRTERLPSEAARRPPAWRRRQPSRSSRSRASDMGTSVEESLAFPGSGGFPRLEQRRVALGLAQVLREDGIAGAQREGRAEVVPAFLVAPQLEAGPAAVEQGLQLAGFQDQGRVEGLAGLGPGLLLIEAAAQIVPGVGDLWILRHGGPEDGLGLGQPRQAGQGLTPPG